MTKRNALEEEREQLFITAVESSDDAIVTKSLDGVITGWNHAAEELFGFTSEDAIGESIDIIVPEELRSEVRRILDRIKNGEKVKYHDTVRVTKDGRRINISLGVSPVKSLSGVIIGAAKVARDNDTRIREQKALLESEQMAQAIIESSLDAFVRLNERGTIVRWSAKAEAMLGWTREEARARHRSRAAGGTRIPRPCAAGARRLSIPSARSRCGWVRRTS